jgi:MazG family protein
LERNAGMHDPDRLADATELFGKLLELIRTLRSENGCPWDKKQSPQTVHPYILEEYHEVVHALSSGDHGEIVDEMGDLLFLVVFLSYILEQEGVGTVSRILAENITKMTRRHPHVFGDVVAEDAEAVIDNWRRIKSSEERISQRESLLDGIPRSLPALNRAQKLAARAARVGFDWTAPEEVLPKIDEELGEFKEAVRAGVPEAISEELGDLLFVLVNAARHLGIHSETVLNRTSDKFERRFRHIEKRLREEGKSLEEATLKEMDALWDEAKELERG